MLHIHLIHMPPSHGHEATCPGTTRQGDRIKEPATLTLNANLRPKSQSTTFIMLRRSHGEVTKVPGQTLHIAAEYSAASRNRMPWARISLNIRKLKSQARV